MEREKPENFDINNLPVGKYAVRTWANDYWRLVTTLDKMENGQIWLCSFSLSQKLGGDYLPSVYVDKPEQAKYILENLNLELKGGKEYIIVSDEQEPCDEPSWYDQLD
jgi:hypothetical protein